MAGDIFFRLGATLWLTGFCVGVAFALGALFREGGAKESLKHIAVAVVGVYALGFAFMGVAVIRTYLI